MQKPQPSLIARDHTVLGVCEALGEDFGFNPLYLRITLSVLLLWNPTVIFSAYLSTGLAVFLLRLLVPDPRPAAGVEKHSVAWPAATSAAESDEPEEQQVAALRIAA
jgi:phage shock protein PspC (stress-responsive transcriptional regulator)